MSLDRLSERIDLPEHETSIGIVFVQGAGQRVGAWADGDLRHMSPAAARRLAGSLAESDEAPALRPVIKALEQTADRVEFLAQPAAGVA